MIFQNGAVEHAKGAKQLQFFQKLWQIIGKKWKKKNPSSNCIQPNSCIDFWSPYFRDPVHHYIFFK